MNPHNSPCPQTRLSRGRSRDRGRQSPAPSGAACLEHQDSTDYAADYSSDPSSSVAVTPLTQSPRKRATTIGDSPLVRGRNERLNKSQLSIDGSLPGASTTTAQLEFLHCDDAKKRHEIALRQHTFFQLRIHLISGQNLVAMDKNGTSDPYVKFKMSGRLLYKSRTVHRNLNPCWDETFVLPIEDPFQRINIKVFDYDWGLQDDFMGSAELDLTSFELNQSHEILLKLFDPAQPEHNVGELRLAATLWPRTQEDKEQVCVYLVRLR